MLAEGVVVYDECIKKDERSENFSHYERTRRARAYPSLPTQGYEDGKIFPSRQRYKSPLQAWIFQSQRLLDALRELRDPFARL